MNRSTETTAHDHTARIARLAWFCAFVLPLILAALLLGVKSAQAAPLTPVVVPFALEDEEELAFDEEGEGEEFEDEDEFAEAECEIAEEELEEGLLTESDVEELCTPVDSGRAGSSAAGCPLRSARAHASTRNGRLKLTIGYTAAASVPATIQVRKVGTFRRRLGRSGVIRLTRKLGRKQAKRIKIRIRVPSSAGGRRCGLVQVVANKVV